MTPSMLHPYPHDRDPETPRAESTTPVLTMLTEEEAREYAAFLAEWSSDQAAEDGLAAGVDSGEASRAINPWDGPNGLAALLRAAEPRPSERSVRDAEARLHEALEAACAQPEGFSGMVAGGLRDVVTSVKAVAEEARRSWSARSPRMVLASAGGVGVALAMVLLLPAALSHRAEQQAWARFEKAAEPWSDWMAEATSDDAIAATIEAWMAVPEEAEMPFGGELFSSMVTVDLAGLTLTSGDSSVIRLLNGDHLNFDLLDREGLYQEDLDRVVEDLLPFDPTFMVPLTTGDTSSS